MNSLFFNVYETSTHYIDPIGDLLMHSIVDRLGVADYFGKSYFYHSDRTAVSVNNDESGNMRMGDRRVDVFADYKLNPDTGQMFPTTNPGNRLVYGTSTRWNYAYQKLWWDPEISVCLLEHTVPFTVVLNFELLFKEFDISQMCLDRLLTLSSENLVTQVRDITYSYPMDFNVISVLYQIYQRRVSENQTLNFFQYINKYLCADLVVEANKYSLTQNQSPETALYFKKYQLRCLGRLRCDQETPETGKQENAPNEFIVKFTFEFQAGRPQFLQLSLPPIIEQTPLPSVLFETQNKGWWPTIPSVMQNKCFSEIITHTLDQQWSESWSIYRFPKYDQWDIPTDDIIIKYQYHPLVIAISPIDRETKTGTVNLTTDLSPLGLHPKIIEFIQLHTQSDIIGYSGLFNFSVFIDDVRLDPDYYTFDAQTLTFTFLGDRPQHIYRIVLSECTNIRFLNRKFYHLILQNRYFFPMTIFKNLDYLCQMGQFCVTTGPGPGNKDPGLVVILKALEKKGLLRKYLGRLIEDGYACGMIFQFTQNMYQLADYLTNTKARFNPNVTLQSERFTSSLFTVLMDILIADGVITPSEKPKEYLRLPIGWPYGPGAGGWAHFNTPFRIQDTTFLIQNT